MATPSTQVARRQPSTTSLSRYVRAEPQLEARSLDFCNAFWGAGDGGVEVLLTRMRGAGRTVDEMKAFYKERVAIEEEYSKKLNKLAKMNVGRDEIGELRNTVDTLRLETDKQASCHLALAQALRSECEAAATEFVAKQTAHRKNYTTAVERFFKNKQTQEGYVQKAREKYEQDCLRINSFTAQSSILQGKELEKTQLKLDRAKSSIQTSEKEYSGFVRALKDTSSRWEKEWKGYCDRCQDLEEERIEFLRDSLWQYANAVSTACVTDDESCEKLRVSLEQLELERDMENFIRDYGTGPLILEPPPFIDYSTTDLRPPPIRSRNANFARSTSRSISVFNGDHTPQPEEEPTSPGNAGIGAGVGSNRRTTTTPPARSQSRAGSINKDAPLVAADMMKTISSPGNLESRPISHAPSKVAAPGIVNRATPQASDYKDASSGAAVKSDTVSSPGYVESRRISYTPSKVTTPGIVNRATPPQASDYKDASSGAAVKSDTVSSPGYVESRRISYTPSKVTTPGIVNQAPPPQASDFKPANDPNAAPVDPTAVTMLRIGDHAYRADPNRDPQSLGRKPTGRIAPPTMSTPTPNGLPAKDTSSIGGQEDPLMKQMNTLQQEGSLRRDKDKDSINRRPTLMQQPPPASSSTYISGLSSVPTPSSVSSTVISETSGPPVNYHAAAEALVGPHPSTSRPTSPAVSPSQPTAVLMKPPPASTSSPNLPVEEVLSNYEQRLPGERPTSRNSRNRESFISVPNASVHRPASPAREGHVGIGAHGRTSPQPRPVSRGPSPQPMASPVGPNTPASGGIGIRLDSYGRVIQDSRADQYGRMPPQQQPPQQRYENLYGYPQSAASVDNLNGSSLARQPTYGSSNQPGWQSSQPPPASAPSGYRATVEQQPVRQASLYNPHPPSRGYSVPSPQHIPAPSQPPRQSQYGYAPSPAPTAPQQVQYHAHNGYGGQPNGVPHGYGQSNQYGGPVNPNIHPQQQDYRQSNGNVAPHVHRSPSPQPPPPQNVYQPQQEPGIMFYVKALYDYRATIDEEFDFQADDIIAVTSTPDDGWWTGMLLDDTRRIPGRTVFPSNFVTFF